MSNLNTRIYGWVVALYPAEFREEYGWLMVQIFEEMCHDAYHRRGMIGLIKVWTRTLFDLITTLPKEHLESRGYRRTKLMDVNTFNTQMNTTVQAFIRDLRDGYNVLQCVERISESASEPTASEFKRLKEDVEGGIPFPDAFNRMQERVHSEPLKHFIDVLNVQRVEGGNLADQLQENLNKFE